MPRQPSRPCQRNNSLVAGVFAAVLGLLALIAPRDARAFQLVDTTGQSYYKGATTILDLPPSQLLQRIPELQGLEPAADQQELSSLLRRTGEQTEILSRRIPNLVSREVVRREQLREDGSVRKELRQEFNYLMLSHVRDHVIEMEEYRTGARGRRIHPEGLEEGFSLTEGFATLWLNFHPSNRSTCEFRLLGQQRLNGLSTYVVAFAQKPGWGALAGTVRFNGTSYVILYQGIAWIDRRNFRIVRLRVDLLAPRPDVGLEKQTTVVSFGEVRIARAASALWLPSEVTVTTKFRGKLFRNTHRYTDYRLFSVKSRIVTAPPESASPPKPH